MSKNEFIQKMVLLWITRMDLDTFEPHMVAVPLENAKRAANALQNIDPNIFGPVEAKSSKNEKAR